MRNEGGEEYFKNIFRAFDVRYEQHIENYGSDNHLRLTGKHETQSIDKFSWGVSDRGSSIRVPLSTAKEWKGYVEDRRPASNGDPYKIVNVISNSIEFEEVLDKTNSNITNNIDLLKISEKYGTLNNEELLAEFVKDNDIDMSETMAHTNEEQTEIHFNVNSK